MNKKLDKGKLDVPIERAKHKIRNVAIVNFKKNVTKPKSLVKTLLMLRDEEIYGERRRENVERKEEMKAGLEKRMDKGYAEMKKAQEEKKNQIQEHVESQVQEIKDHVNCCIRRIEEYVESLKREIGEIKDEVQRKTT
ncbi:hypothetical protein AVEN_262912-1 [Araneus ventricosus]|uniref:Uncharacterized protein n=1 Tax=Araneus ventricosus TaxID=182803 RepID=A0A4Y2DJJ2_ARAVE|nr:hypothetical protein AVEN_262912-1 [Araneus ventricosus]